MEYGALTGVSSDEGVVSKEDYKKLQARARRLERIPGMETEEQQRAGKKIACKKGTG